jgi:hypothetical protein
MAVNPPPHQNGYDLGSLDISSSDLDLVDEVVINQLNNPSSEEPANEVTELERQLETILATLEDISHHQIELGRELGTELDRMTRSIDSYVQVSRALDRQLQLIYDQSAKHHRIMLRYIREINVPLKERHGIFKKIIRGQRRTNLELIFVGLMSGMILICGLSILFELKGDRQPQVGISLPEVLAPPNVSGKLSNV